MEEVFEFTKSQLTEAFRIYNIEALEEPDQFGEIDDSEESARLQVEKILSILERLRSNAV